MIRLLSVHHPAANPSLLLPLCPAAEQRGRGGERGGEGLAEAQLPHVFQDGVSPFAPGLPLTAGHSPPVGGAMPQRAEANGNRAGGSRSPGTGCC